MFAPNTIIENLLQQKKHHAAMTLDALFAVDVAAIPSLEISAVLHYFRAAGIGIGESIVRRGLFDLARLGLAATRKIMTRTKGRPRWEYRLASLSGMAQVLGVKLHRDENRDSVPFTAFKSGRAYRGAKHYSFIARLGTSHLSRKKLGARLGVGGRSTFNYEQGTNIKAEERIETKQLFRYDIALAPEKRLNANIFLKVEFVRELSDAEFAEKHKEVAPDNHIFQRRTITDFRYMPYTRFILERELAAGHTVFLVKQITNEYSIAA